MSKIILKKGTNIQLVSDGGETISINCDNDIVFNKDELTISDSVIVYSYHTPYPVYMDENVKEIRWRYEATI